jgi:AraC-like DNA-binding protein
MAVPLEIGSVLTLSFPIVGALFAWMMLVMDARWNKQDSALENHILMAYFLMTALNLGQIVSLHFNSEFYIWTTTFGLLSYGVIQITFYWFVFELTRMDAQERFSPAHFILPIVFSLILLVLLLINKSIEPLVDLVNGKDTQANRSYLTLYMGNVYGLKLFFGVAYITLSSLRLIRYNRLIRNYSANEEKASLRWLWFLLVISVLAMPFPLIWIALEGKLLVSFFAILIYSLMLLYFYVYLTLHVIRKDKFRVVLELDPEPEPVVPVEIFKREDSGISKKSILTKTLFEDYMVKHKPYLNQDLRITDLVDVFHVNRTYISSFINLEYNVNFSTYINSHRMVEYRRLSMLPECLNKSKQELVEMAGFNSYRSFLRIKGLKQ